MVRVHLDTDIGGDIDDLCALALLLRSPEVEITGITTVIDHGGKRAGYARFALSLAGRSDVSVAAGADVNLGRYALGTDLPPEERFWPSPVRPLPGPLDAALDLLERSLAAGAILISIGPLTNLALLEERRPGILRRAQLCSMAGHVRKAPQGCPQWDHMMDYNVQADPAAALLVLQSSETTLVPIEATAQTALRRSDVAVLRRSDPLCQLLAHQAEAFTPNGEFINYQHDPLACAVALGWPGVAIESLPLSITREDGFVRMREATGGLHQLRVVTGVDRDAFSRYWLDTVTRASRS
jgi:inosine-uridine nucleoside N-ribohydrolase